MEHETLMLKSLFAACLLSCLLVLGAMLTTRADAPLPHTASTLAASSSPCVAPNGGLACPLPRG